MTTIGATVPLSAQQRLLLAGATLIDGNGGPPLAAARIVIESGRFTCVSGPTGCPQQQGDRTIDLRDHWIVPGLIDTHVHLPMTASPTATMRSQRLRFALGITTVRDAGSPSTRTLLAARPIAANPERPVPRLVVASRVEPADAARLGVALGAALVEKLTESGVDAIKIKPPFDHEIWREEIRAARRAGVPAFGHTWSSPTEEFTRGAIAEGISGISHIMGLVIAVQPAGAKLIAPAGEEAFWAWEKGLWLTTDAARVDTLLQEIIAAHVWLEPTLASEYHFGRGLVAPQEVEFLRPPPSLVDFLRASAALAPRTPPNFPEAWRKQAEFVAEFIRRGGVVVAGSDELPPGIGLHEEMALIGDVAGSPMVGLQAATTNAAAALNRPDLGAIAVGKLGDALVYRSNPLAREGGTLAIDQVIKAGVVYQADSLRAEFRAEYAARVQTAWQARTARATKGGAALVVVVVASLVVRRRSGRGEEAEG